MIGLEEEKRRPFGGAGTFSGGFHSRREKTSRVIADNEPTDIPRSWVMLDVMVMFEKSVAKDVPVFYLAKMFVSMWKGV